MSDCDGPNPPEILAQFPEGSQPENRINSINALCSYGMRPYVMTGLLRQLLLGHFADVNNIEDPRLRRQLETIGTWQPADNGLNAGGILIESITRWQPATTDKRPGILLRRNDWEWQRLGIGDKLSTNVYEGSTQHSGLWAGSHTVFCLTPHGGEVELLGVEVMKFLHHFAPWIRKQMNLMRFFVSKIGAVGEVKETNQGYAVPVTVSYMAEESWELQPYAPRLKRIVLKTTDLLSY